MRSFNCRRDGKDMACQGSMAPQVHALAAQDIWHAGVAVTYDFLVFNSHHQEGIVFFPLLLGSAAAAALHSHRREALLLHGCDEGWNKLDWEVDKKIVDRQRLFSILAQTT